MLLHINYKTKNFRLSEKTVENLDKIKNETGLSYNMLFTAIINSYMEIQKTNKIGKVIWDNIKEGDECPYCKIGTIVQRLGKYGSFWACDNFPNCGFTQGIKPNN
jgi:ssDNA-binding Zn-finger/Zn-ribbon topoisomerase 1